MISSDLLGEQPLVHRTLSIKDVGKTDSEHMEKNWPRGLGSGFRTEPNPKPKDYSKSAISIMWPVDAGKLLPAFVDYFEKRSLSNGASVPIMWTPGPGEIIKASTHSHPLLLFPEGVCIFCCVLQYMQNNSCRL